MNAKTKNSSDFLGMTALLEDYTRAASLLIESSIGTWVDEHPGEASQLVAGLSDGSLSIELISAVYPDPHIKIIATPLDKSNEHQVLVQFIQDKKGWQ